MTRYGHQGKRDSNHGELVGVFRNCGCSVLDLGMVGNGCPDVCVGFMGETHLVEFKSEKGKLTEDQRQFVDRWRGDHFIVRSAEEAISLVRSWVTRRSEYLSK